MPDPGKPGPGQVRLRMTFAPVNPADRLVAAGRYAPMAELPEVMGAEGVGIVEAVGDGINAIAPGDRAIPLPRGNWATIRLLDAAELIPVPAFLDDRQAAMLRINPATAARLLTRLALKPGARLLQNAPRSSVAGWLRRLAARAKIDVPGEDDDRPADAALDAVAGDATGRLAARLVPGGQLIVYGHLSGQPCSIPSTLLTTRDLTVSGFSLRPAEATDPPAARRAFYSDLATLAAAAPEPVSAIFALDEVEKAFAAAAIRGRKGRILLRLSD
ncbi:MAG: alcohol dehydrogenase catalytic domain-containing protein [Flavobacteriaceae bacterium]